MSERLDPWQEMDDWCAKQSDDISDTFERRFMEEGVPIDSPGMRRLVGQSLAFGRMRSFIHGARTRGDHLKGD